MAINQVRAKLNGTWHTLTLNSATGKYEAQVTAPGATSYNLEGGYYPVTVEVSNTAGTVVTAEAAGMAGLRLVVKETVKPVISILSPSAAAYITSNQPTMSFNVTDEQGGSGVNLATVSATLDGTPITGLARTSITNGYKFSYTPPSALSDGAHTLAVTAKDNDGNTAQGISVTFTIDTVPPSLVVNFPASNLETNTPSITVTGTTNDATSSPVTVTVTLNDIGQGAVTVGSNGSFSKGVTLTEGTNTLTVKSTDKAGKSTTVTRTIMLDTTVPVIKSASVSPNPSDTGATVIISVEIE